MSPAFQTGRRSAQITFQLQRARRRRRVVALLMTLILIPAGLYLLDHYLKSSGELPAGRILPQKM